MPGEEKQVKWVPSEQWQRGMPCRIKKGVSCQEQDENCCSGCEIYLEKYKPAEAGYLDNN
jgi:hypothetical protein